MKRANTGKKKAVKKRLNIGQQILNQINKNIGESNIIGDFAVGSILTYAELSNTPMIHISEYGIIPLPLNKTIFNDIKRHFKDSHYGLGERTLINKNVRNSIELTPHGFSIKNETFVQNVNTLIQNKIKGALGLTKSKVTAKIYKLLIYETGGKFDRHTDTEKEDNMFGTLIIQLPSIFTGGDMVISHNGKEHVFKNDLPGADHQCAFVAHYSSCPHELKRIMSGYRVALVYSLCWDGNGLEPVPYTSSNDSVQLSSLINQYLDHKSEAYLCWALEFEYSNFSINYGNMSSLKGSDRVFVGAILNVLKHDNEQNSANHQYEQNSANHQYELFIASANKHVSEYGDCGKHEYHGGWGRRRWHNPCGSTNCGGEWYADEGPTFELTDFSSLIDLSVIYDGLTMELCPEDDILNYNEFESDDLWDYDKGEGCSGPSGNEGSTREKWYQVKVVILCKKGSTFSDSCNEYKTKSKRRNSHPTVAVIAVPETGWEQPKAFVPDHPVVTTFMRGPDKSLRYKAFNDIGHAGNWASKHADDHGCSMTIRTGVDRNGVAYADITKDGSEEKSEGDSEEEAELEDSEEESQAGSDDSEKDSDCIWRQSKAIVPNHPVVTKFMRGPDKSLCYKVFNDIDHADNWASKHAYDRGCSMTISTGIDENDDAYAYIKKKKKHN